MTTDRTLDRDALAELIAEHLSGTYHCTRVWSAWGVGTMTQDDFEPVDESDTPGEIADAIIAKLNADRTQSAQAVAEPAPGNIGFSEDRHDAIRFRALCDDHQDKNVRAAIRELIERLPVMSLAAVRRDIDAMFANSAQSHQADEALPTPKAETVRCAHAAWTAFEKFASDRATHNDAANLVVIREYLMAAARVGRYRDTAPAAVEPVEIDYPHEQMDALALARYKVLPSDQSMYWRHAVVAGEGLQHLYNGSEVDCQIVARKFAGAFLDGAFTFHQRYTAPRAQPSDALDAARLDYLSTGSTVELLPSEATFYPMSFRVGGLYIATNLRMAIDAAIAAQAAQINVGM